MPQPASEFKANTRGWQNLSGETSEERRARERERLARVSWKASGEEFQKRRSTKCGGVGRETFWRSKEQGRFMHASEGAKEECLLTRKTSW